MKRVSTTPLNINLMSKRSKTEPKVYNGSTTRAAKLARKKKPTRKTFSPEDSKGTVSRATMEAIKKSTWAYLADSLTVEEPTTRKTFSSEDSIIIMREDTYHRHPGLRPVGTPKGTVSRETMEAIKKSNWAYLAESLTVEEPGYNPICTIDVTSGDKAAEPSK